MVLSPQCACSLGLVNSQVLCKKRDVFSPSLPTPQIWLSGIYSYHRNWDQCWKGEVSTPLVIKSVGNTAEKSACFELRKKIQERTEESSFFLSKVCYTILQMYRKQILIMIDVLCNKAFCIITCIKLYIHWCYYLDDYVPRCNWFVLCNYVLTTVWLNFTSH